MTFLERLRREYVAENMRNCRIRKHNQCDFKGVQIHSQSGKYRARIRIDEDQRHLGLFGTPTEAHAAYVAASQKFHGEYGRST